MKQGRTLLTASLVALVTATALPVHAQADAVPSSPSAGAQPSATDQRALAETLFFTARGLMEAGRYAEACPKLAESYRLDAAAGTLLNLAVCHEKSGKVASAWGEYREAAADAKRMNRPDREQLAAQHEAALEPELPFLTITVPPEIAKIPGLVISQNGTPLMSAAWNTELPVDPGEVEILEKAPGYKPKTLHVTIANKEHKSLTAERLALKPVEVAPAPFWTGRRTTGALVFVGGVGLATAASIFGIQAINEKKKSDADCINWPQGTSTLRCSQAGVDEMSKANTYAWISDIGFGLSAVAAVAGVYMFVTGDTAGTPLARPTTGSSQWSWQIGGLPGGAQGAVSRSF